MANETGGKCEECDRALSAQTGKGRRRQFCNATCRSAARRRRAPVPPTLCELRLGWRDCGQLAAGWVRGRGGARVAACGPHRDVATAWLAADGLVAWQPFTTPGRPDSAGVAHQLDPAAPVVPVDDAAGYALVYSAVDGWEVYDGEDLVAGHDGYEADDVDAAQAWAAQLLVDEDDVAVSGWRARPHRVDPSGESVEYAAVLAG